VPNQGISKDERDPRIFWHAPSARWIMALWVAHGHVRFFSSADLKTWLHTSDFHIDGFYECPDVLELPLDGGPQTRWIIYDAAGNYSVGRFDGIRFEADQRPRKADFGANFYAAQTWTNTPGKCIQIAWMRDGKYPGMPFNQQMSFPCELKLRTFPDGLRICRLPVREIENIRSKKHKWENKILAPGENLLSGITGELFDIRAEFEISDSAEFGIKVRGEAIIYNAQGQKIYCLGKAASLTPAAKRIKLHILVDRTSIEIFGNEGMVSMTSCFLPKDEGKALELYVTSGSTVKIVSLHIYELRSIWADTKASV
jgi:fructan beta-fructosidase